MSAQLDLFANSAQAEQERADWLALFEPAEWVAPWDCGYGPAGTVVPAFRCPGCGQVAPGPHGLKLDHGLDPHVPRWDDPDEPWCRRLHYHRYRAAHDDLPPLSIEPPLDCRACGRAFLFLAEWETHDMTNPYTAAGLPEWVHWPSNQRATGHHPDPDRPSHTRCGLPLDGAEPIERPFFGCTACLPRPATAVTVDGPDLFDEG